MSPTNTTALAATEFLTYLRRVGGLTETMRFEDLRDVEWAIKKVQGWLAPTDKPVDAWPVWYGDGDGGHVKTVSIWDGSGIPTLLDFHQKAFLAYQSFQRRLATPDKKEKNSWPGGEFCHTLVGHIIGELILPLNTAPGRFSDFTKLVRSLPGYLDSVNMKERAQALYEYTIQIKNCNAKEHDEYRNFLEVAGRTNTEATQDFLREADSVLSVIREHIHSRRDELVKLTQSYYNKYIPRQEGATGTWEGWVQPENMLEFAQNGHTYRFPEIKETNRPQHEPGPIDKTNSTKHKPVSVDEGLSEMERAWLKTCRDLALLELDVYDKNVRKSLSDITTKLWTHVLSLPYDIRLVSDHQGYLRDRLLNTLRHYEAWLFRPTLTITAEHFIPQYTVEELAVITGLALDGFRKAVQKLAEKRANHYYTTNRTREYRNISACIRAGETYYQVNEDHIVAFCTKYNISYEFTDKHNYLLDHIGAVAAKYNLAYQFTDEHNDEDNSNP